MAQKPKSIIDAEWAARWDAIFGRDLKEESKPVLTDEVLAVYNNERLVSKMDKQQAWTNQTESNK